MKILLIWPKSRTDPEWGGDLGAIAEPLALEYLGATARELGHQVEILDLRLFPDALDKTYRELQPDVVGVTGFSMHVGAGKTVLRRMKELNPHCVTVAGGHHATFLPEDFFEPFVDYVVCGEGTGKFRQLLENLERAVPDAPIGGVWRRCALKAERPPSQLPLVGEGARSSDLWQRGELAFRRGGEPDDFDVNALPRPERHLTAGYRHNYFIDWMKPVALLRSTVGCPYRCTFCSLWKLMEGRYHTRRIEDVVDELRTIEEPFVFLIDDEAFINRQRMLELASAIEAASIKKRFFTYCRIDTLLRNRDAVAAWVKIGLERLLIGIDAISDAEIEAYTKNCRLDQIEDGIRLAEELGVEIFAQFVVSPEYDKRDFVRLRRFVEHNRLKYPSFTVLTPLPGTELLGNFSSVTKLQSNGRPDWDFFDTQNAVTATRLPEGDFRREYRNLFRIFRGSYSQFHHYHTLPGQVSERQLGGNTRVQEG